MVAIYRQRKTMPLNLIESQARIVNSIERGNTKEMFKENHPIHAWIPYLIHPRIHLAIYNPRITRVPFNTSIPDIDVKTDSRLDHPETIIIQKRSKAASPLPPFLGILHRCERVHGVHRYAYVSDRVAVYNFSHELSFFLHVSLFFPLSVAKCIRESQMPFVRPQRNTVYEYTSLCFGSRRRVLPILRSFHIVFFFFVFRLLPSTYTCHLGRAAESKLPKGWKSPRHAKRIIDRIR